MGNRLWVKYHRGRKMGGYAAVQMKGIKDTKIAQKLYGMDE